MLAGISLYAADAPKDKYSMFPQAEEAYARYIIEVPKTENDYDHKIELLIGKNMMVDCNHHSFSGKIEKLPLKGWGYSYYRISDIKSGPTTMRACREPKKEAFITVYLPQEMQFMRYNSRLGTVIYVPQDFEVRYRIWDAGKTIRKAQQK
jgi:ecotin